MSFLGILKNIGKGFLVAEQIAMPIAQTMLPQFAPVLGRIDNLVQRTQAAIITVEQNNPADGQGGVKQEAVIADFQAGLDEMQSILALSGKKLTYDEGELKSAINDQTSAYNHFAKVKASFKVEAV